jgi:hypothetical protein
VRAERAAFGTLALDAVDPVACVAHLGAKAASALFAARWASLRSRVQRFPGGP